MGFQDHLGFQTAWKNETRKESHQESCPHQADDNHPRLLRVEKALQRCSLRGLSASNPSHAISSLVSYPCSFSVSYQQPQLPSPLLSTHSASLDRRTWTNFSTCQAATPRGSWQLSKQGAWESTRARPHRCYYAYFPYFVKLCWSRTPLCHPNTAQEGPKRTSPEDKT